MRDDTDGGERAHLFTCFIIASVRLAQIKVQYFTFVNYKTQVETVKDATIFEHTHVSYVYNQFSLCF